MRGRGGLPGRVFWHLVRTLRPGHWYLWAGRTFSQSGEDVVVRNYFRHRSPGFYVDVGAHHPYRFSNTFLLYQRGWRGLNIDPLPGIAEEFRRRRPRDETLELGVAEGPGRMTYWRFDEPAFNTFDAEVAASRIDGGAARLLERTEVPVRPLSAILDEHLTPGQAVDLLTVDAEGLDLAVLRSNDWGRWRPEVVVAEALDGDDPSQGEPASGGAPHPVQAFLAELGYGVHARMGHSLIFVDRAGRPRQRPAP